MADAGRSNAGDETNRMKVMIMMMLIVLKWRCRGASYLYKKTAGHAEGGQTHSDDDNKKMEFVG